MDNEPPESFALYRTRTSSSITRKPQEMEIMVQEDPGCDELEYLECGPSPMTDYGSICGSIEEIATKELGVPICYDTIRTSLVQLMSASSGRYSLLTEIETRKIVQENLEASLLPASKLEINIAFLWAAFLKRWDLLSGFLKLGASIDYHEPNNGLGALHLSAYSDGIPGTQFLIKQGCEVNAIFKCYAPLHCAAFGDSSETALILLNNGASLQTFANQDTVLHCAIRANAISCVKLFTSKQPEIIHVESSGISAIHLAGSMGHAECLRIIIKSKGVDINKKTKKDGQSALHLACKGGFAECVEVLLEKNADVNGRNNRGQTPLHLASKAQAYECVKLLLKNGKADPNVVDRDGKTALHTAVGKNTKSYDMIEMLVRFGADVNLRDNSGYTALHLAALHGLSECVEDLIYYGADVTAKTKFGVTALRIILRKTPASLAMITQNLDSAITLQHHPDSFSRDVELRLDFRSILQHCHPREISFLNTFVDEGQKEILLHPLCSAFLYLKWEKMRKYYFARILICFIFVLSLSLYVFTALAHHCYNQGKNMNDTDEPDNIIELCEKKSIMGHMLRANPFVIEMQWFVLVAITCCEIIRKIYGLVGYSSIKQYFRHPENIIEWCVIVSVFVISFIYTNRTYTWQNHVGAFAVLFSWTNLMLMVGQLPVFGTYVAMYTKVQGEFAKLLLAYSCLLIGFTISFCVIFPESSTFANPLIGFVTVFTMMIGEINLNLIADEDQDDPPFLLEISAQVTFVLFLLFVTVILMNLLVGIAVDDIQGLQKTAGLSKLVRQTKLIFYMERALFNGYLPKYFLNLLHWSALVSPKAYRVVLNVKPLNPREKRLPQDVLKAAYEIAKKPKSYGHTVLPNDSPGTPYLNKIFDYNASQNSGFQSINSDAFNTLQDKLERNTEQIENLDKEIKNLRNSFDKNKRVIHLLNIVVENLCKEEMN